MPKTPEDRISTLVAELNEHNYRYNVLNEPSISDQEFDRLLHELTDLEAAHPNLVLPESPTQRVGSDLSKAFPTVVHELPMLSWTTPTPRMNCTNSKPAFAANCPMKPFGTSRN